MDQVSSSLRCKVFEMIYEVLSRLTDRPFGTILNDSGRLQLQIRTSNDMLDANKGERERGFVMSRKKVAVLKAS